MTNYHRPHKQATSDYRIDLVIERWKPHKLSAMITEQMEKVRGRHVEYVHIKQMKHGIQVVADPRYDEYDEMMGLARTTCEMCSKQGKRRRGMGMFCDEHYLYYKYNVHVYKRKSKKSRGRKKSNLRKGNRRIYAYKRRVPKDGGGSGQGD